MLSGQVAANLSPGPILEAADRYRGAFVDLDRRLTVDQSRLARGREYLASRFAQAGMEPGDRLVVAVGNGPLFVATLAAILDRQGSPLLLHGKTPLAELKRTAVAMSARYVVSDACRADDLSAEIGRTASISDDTWIELGVAEFAIRRENDPFPSIPAVPLHPTSGTTGVPKVAIRPGFCAMEEARHYVETIGIDAGDVILAVPPMSHAYAYGMCVMVPLLSNASVVSMRAFSPKLVFQTLAERRITIFPAVPAMLDALMFGAADRLRRVSRCVLSAGAPLPEKTSRRLEQQAGRTVRPLYGTTETGGITVASDAQGAVGGCVGRPMSGVLAQVRTEDAQQCPRDDVGMLYIRSSSMMAGYLGPGAVDATPLEDGWFKTGDLARIDDSGAIHLKGRHSEVINVAGMKVIPGDVEEVIGAMPGVVEVAVYAGRTRLGEEFVKAAVALEKDLDVAGVRRHCEKNLVYYKCPKQIIPVGALPRSPAGKIIRGELP